MADTCSKDEQTEVKAATTSCNWSKVPSLRVRRLLLELKLQGDDFKQSGVQAAIEQLRQYEDDMALLKHLALDSQVDPFVQSLAQSCLEEGGARIEQLLRHMDVNIKYVPASLLSGRRCETCGKGGDDARDCTACHFVCYCSKTCQRSHWKASHKAQCALLKQSEDDDSASNFNKLEAKFGAACAAGMVSHLYTLALTDCTTAQATTRLTQPDGDLNVLRHWLMAHAAPCTLAITCSQDAKSIVGRLAPLTTDATLACGACGSLTVPARFCRRCTLVNVCQGCHTQTKCQERVKYLDKLVPSVRFRHLRPPLATKNNNKVESSAAAATNASECASLR